MNTPFTVTEKSGGDSSEEALVVSGYASTADRDRDGDIVEAKAWTKSSALENYLQNPIILAFHDHTRPIGKMIDYNVDGKGLHITAEISKAAGEIYTLVKEGVLKTFSIGFMIKDAVFDKESDVFSIKEVELYETSVVSVPANQSATFSIGKEFDSKKEYEEFKNQFSINEEIKEEKTMSEGIENKPAVENNVSADAVADIVAKAIADNEARKQAEEEAKRKEAEKISIAVKEATDRLEEDMQKKLEEAGQNEEKLNKAIAELAAQSKEQAEQLEAARKNKMRYNGVAEGDIAASERDTAILLAKCMGTSLEATKTGQKLVEKAGANVPNADWEESFNTNLLMDLREELKLEPLFRKIAMPTPSLRFPLNPEAAYAEWVNGAKGTAGVDGTQSTTRTGEAKNQVLEEVILTSKTLATKSYVGYEEEEDAILPIMPIVREALIRRMARASDKSFLMGTASGLTGAGAGISGLAQFANNTAQTDNQGAAVASEVLSINDLLQARVRLGRHGLDTSKLVYLVDISGYYDLLNEGNTAGNSFKTMDQVGDRATLLTGQMASLGGVPIIVTEAFNTAGANEPRAGIVHLNNYMIGEQRGMKVEQESSAEYQTKVLVATRRMAFQQIETGVGCEMITFNDGV